MAHHFSTPSHLFSAAFASCAIAVGLVLAPGDTQGAIAQLRQPAPSNAERLSPSPSTEVLTLAQSSSTQTCETAIAATRSQILQGRTLSLDGMSSDLSAEYDTYPGDRSQGYIFRLAGASAESVMNSPQFLTTLSNNIINGCGSVGAVSFNLSGTGLTRTFGLLESGVAEFQCLPPGGSSRTRPWGYIYCF